MPETTQVDVVECNFDPEIRIGRVGEAHKGSITEFDDWEQFERFVSS